MERTQITSLGRVDPGPSRAMLVLVTGAGRSGTSTMAGALHHLGLHIPGPFLKANASNPRGFYESAWSVAFHNTLLRRANVTLTDGRPEAARLVESTVTPETRRELSTWLAQGHGHESQMVVKDPRMVWTFGLWSAAAAELAMQIGYIIMLRHPAEVLGSRATYYAAALDRYGARGYATKNLATWINANLTAERTSRGQPRCFVRYDDLLLDWRAQMSRVAAECALITPLDPDMHRSVDEFVDPALHRVRTTWHDLAVPADLRAVADDVWSACGSLAEVGGSAAAYEKLDAAGERYAQLCADALALSTDARNAAVRRARAVGAAAATATSAKGAGSGTGKRSRGLRRRPSIGWFWARRPTGRRAQNRGG
jgi:hypothetical protein